MNSHKWNQGKIFIVCFVLVFIVLLFRITYTGILLTINQLNNQSQSNSMNDTYIQFSLQKIKKYKKLQQTNPKSLTIALKLCGLYHYIVITNTGLIWAGKSRNKSRTELYAMDDVRQCAIILRHSISNSVRLFYSGLQAEDAVTANNIQSAKSIITRMKKLLTLCKNCDKQDIENAHFFIDEVSGRIAVRNGKWDLASTLLLRAGNVSGNPYSSDLGPNMRLAHELLEHGDEVIVIKYIRECMNSSHSEGTNSILQQWIADINHGIIPAFGNPTSDVCFGLSY